MKTIGSWFLVLSSLCLLAPYGSMAQAQPGPGAGISASLIANELKALGYSASIDEDNSGDPRVNTKVDSYEWSIYFYGCDTGALGDRQCTSFQFYSGYTMPKATSLQTINKWNTTERYAKAYNYVQRDGSFSSRIEVDVLVRGTDADPVKTFRAHFKTMKEKAIDFRKAIGFRG